METVFSDMVKVDEFKDPVAIKEEHFPKVQELHVFTDNLVKVRQEIGRLHQMLRALTEKADQFELDAASRRRELISLYGLDRSPGQWAVDFEEKTFVKLDATAPVIP